MIILLLNSVIYNWLMQEGIAMLVLLRDPGVENQERRYPCLDEKGHYKNFPCSRCQADRCWMDEKPASTRPVVHPGQRRCDHCGDPYHPHGRSRYCSETCRYQMMMRRRRRRRAGNRCAVSP